MAKGILSRVLPNKLTAAQRAGIKTAKIKQSTGKSAISEAGRTIRSVAGTLAGTRIVQARSAAETAKNIQSAANTENIAKALNLYESIIKANPSNEGESGKTSTTEVGGGGSAISG